MEVFYLQLMYRLSIKSNINNYNILFINSFKKEIKKYKQNTFYIIDEKIFNLYNLNYILEKNVVKIKANEKTKEYNYISKIIKRLILLKISKKDKIVSIGGGITQDVTSFISMVLFRGISWEYFPTSLLAMGDSCIGSKLSVNFNNFKNQIGGYYPPSKIYIDISFLDTLSKKHIYSGLGELCHYHFISNKNDFDFFSNSLHKIFKKNIPATKLLILNTLKIKKKFIEIDEFDISQRLILNYGHTFGHAIESYFGYKIPHGLAICIGMNLSNYFSYKKKYISLIEFKKMEKVLKLIKSDLGINKINLNSYLKLLEKDKKVISGTSRFIFTKGIGKMFINKINLNKNFIEILKSYKKYYG